MTKAGIEIARAAAMTWPRHRSPGGDQRRRVELMSFIAEPQNSMNEHSKKNSLHSGSIVLFVRGRLVSVRRDRTSD